MRSLRLGLVAVLLAECLLCRPGIAQDTAAEREQARKPLLPLALPPPPKGQPEPGPTGPAPTITPPTATTRAPTATPRKLVYYRDLDLYGDDLAPFLPDHTLSSCGEACRAESACRAFTFNVSQRACILKSGPGRPTNNTNAISGAIDDGRGRLARLPNPIRIDIKVGIDYAGGDLREQRPTTLDECQLQCLLESRCVAFSYDESKSWCWLKSTLTPPRRKSDVTSGTKF